jgi:dTDP-4-amino-4,6-dideoxygalactose transaminase
MTPGQRRLAILGGEPAFRDQLHVGQPNIGDRQRLLVRIGDLLDRKWLTNNGPLVHEFESQVAQHAGVKHCIATCNATVALEIAIRATGLSGEVIVPSFTFIATAHALQWQGIRPLFCDIDPVTHNIDPGKLAQMITPRTTGIIGVHLWGRPCAVDALTELAARHGLRLLFDAAHAFACSCRGRMIGGFGDAEVLSFHATKFLNTFEGGAILTNDDELAARMRLMTNFGFAGYDNVTQIGTNGKMSEVAAAMGLTNLESLGCFVSTNQANYRCYRGGLAALPGISLIRYDDGEKCNYQYVVVEVDEREAGLHRDHLLKALHAERILARRYFWPGCHRMEPYRSYYPDAELSLPATNRVAERVLVLPTGTATGPDEIEIICSTIRLALQSSDVIRRGLAS